MRRSGLLLQVKNELWSAMALTDINYDGNHDVALSSTTKVCTSLCSIMAMPAVGGTTL